MTIRGNHHKGEWDIHREPSWPFVRMKLDDPFQVLVLLFRCSNTQKLWGLTNGQEIRWNGHGTGGNSRVIGPSAIAVDWKRHLEVRPNIPRQLRHHHHLLAVRLYTRAPRRTFTSLCHKR